MIFFTGMPGCGKTFWAKKVAENLGYGFIDLDDEITAVAGKTICEIFNADGEAAFRALETKCLASTIATYNSATIVACGGGTPCFGEHISIMRAAGTIVYLDAPITFILNNILKDPQRRPMFAGQTDLPSLLEALLHQRLPFYMQADCILSVAGITLATFTENLKRCINQRF